MAESELVGSVCKLGFGLMRLPESSPGTIDIPETQKMVDYFMSQGLNYFDTAVVYYNGESEKAAKKMLVDRYPRESFYLATKLWMADMTGPADVEKMFRESLERTGAGYFDFYLLHTLDAALFQKSEALGAWEFGKEQKKKGRVKHFGFSFHDTADVLEEILEKHYDDADFVQLQINYADWDNPKIQSRKCYEVARKYDMPIIVMEPIKGGALAVGTEEIQQLFRAADPEASVASWAVRFAASHEGIMTVLSGMSTLEQMKDNVSFMKDFRPLSAEEMRVIDRAVELFNNIPQIPCTACRYCVEGCPQKINIPWVISRYNDNMRYNTYERYRKSYENGTKDGGKASSCIRCGSCMRHCPQHIDIIGALEKTAAMFETAR